MSNSYVEVSGTAKRTVHCRSCGHVYQYHMHRTAIGTYSGFAFTREKADEKAEVNGAAKLQRMLEEDSDAVACPKCGTLSEGVGQNREFSGALLALLCGGVLVAIVVVVGLNSGRWYIKWGGLGLFIFFGGLISLITPKPPTRPILVPEEPPEPTPAAVLAQKQSDPSQ